MANNSNDFPSGTCPDSDHIAQERSRLRSASQRHFAQNAQQAAPPKQKQATGGPAKASSSQGPTDVEDEM